MGKSSPLVKGHMTTTSKESSPLGGGHLAITLQQRRANHALALLPKVV